jgi:hypothetical protein
MTSFTDPKTIWGYSNETVLRILLGKRVELIRNPHRH